MVNVNNPTATAQAGAGGRIIDNIPDYIGPDQSSAQELEALLGTAFNMCESTKDVEGLTSEISAALAAVGLPTNGPLMDYVTQLGAQARARLGDPTAAAPVETPHLAADADQAKELEVLLYGAYTQCASAADVQGLTAKISAALANAGLPTTGPMMDFVGQLDGLAQQTVAQLEQQRQQQQQQYLEAKANAPTSGW